MNFTERRRSSALLRANRRRSGALAFVWEWFREMKHRTTASTKSREVARLEHELSVMRDARTVPQDDILALLDQPGSGSRAR